MTTFNDPRVDRPTTYPSDHGFILLLPDGIMQGLVTAIGAHLGRYGVHPVAATARTLTERDRTALYEHGNRSKTSARGRAHGPTMTRRLLELDDSIAVVVRSDQAGRDVSRLLHNIKGPSSFLLRDPCGLRSISNSADRCMSLVHTPDDSAEAARDAARFFRATVLAPDWKGRRLTWEFVAGCRAYEVPNGSASRYAIAIRTVMRCACLLLGGRHPLSSVPESALWTVYEACTLWLAELPNPASAEEHDRFVATCDHLARLDDWMPGAGWECRDEFVSTVSAVLASLLDPRSYNHKMGLGLLAQLDRLRLSLTPYEAHHLLTLTTFFEP
ncbi:hypothetical protein [Actinomycetospora sp. NBRC 106375]|uniref:hypothetical protein n=1 Tax=Actinomycetospora sp. NBRC 106375 TaxID=3032207 RepID=UPI002553BE5B|nr:hypothetical protein [Actinomycetospora sp. NBRC 106375]